MKNIKNIVAAIVMATLLSVSTFAGDGILVGGKDGILVGGKGQQNVKAGNNGCTANTKGNSGILVAGGILVGGFTGILVGGFTGILVGGATGDTSCKDGLLIADRDGLLIAD